jgi:hypothetical protein
MDTIVRQKQVVYGPNFLTRRRYSDRISGLSGQTRNLEVPGSILTPIVD